GLVGDEGVAVLEGCRWRIGSVSVVVNDVIAAWLWLVLRHPRGANLDCSVAFLGRDEKDGAASARLEAFEFQCVHHFVALVAGHFPFGWHGCSFGWLVV